MLQLGGQVVRTYKCRAGSRHLSLANSALTTERLNMCIVKVLAFGGAVLVDPLVYGLQVTRNHNEIIVCEKIIRVLIS